MGIFDILKRQRERKRREMEDAERHLFDTPYDLVKASGDILAFAQYTMAEYRLWEDASIREARSRGKELSQQYHELGLTENELWDVHAWNITTLYEEVRRGLTTIDRCLQKYSEEKAKSPPEQREEAAHNVKRALLMLWDVYRHDGQLLAGCPSLEQALPRSYAI